MIYVLPIILPPVGNGVLGLNAVTNAVSVTTAAVLAAFTVASLVPSVRKDLPIMAVPATNCVFKVGVSLARTTRCVPSPAGPLLLSIGIFLICTRLLVGFDEPNAIMPPLYQKH